MARVVQHDGYDAGNNPQTLTKSVTAGNLLILGQRVAGTNAGATAPSDGVNTWLKAKAVDQTTDGHTGIIWYCIAATTASLSIATVQNAGSGSNRGVFAEITCGVPFVSPLDKVAGAQGNNPTTYDSGATATLSQADEIAIGLTTGDSGYTWGTPTPWHELEESNTTGRVGLFYQETVATTAVDLAGSISPLNWTAMIATFKIPAEIKPLGYSTAGSHIDNNLSDHIIACGYYTTDANGGIVEDGQVWFDSLTSTGTRSQACRLIIFADNGSGTGPSTTVVAVSDEVLATDTTTPSSWVEFPFSSPPTLAPLTKYWVAFWWGTQVGGDARWQVDWDFSINPADSFEAHPVTYASTGNPTVSSWSDIGSTVGYSWYVHYDSATGVAIPTPPGVPMQGYGRF